MGIWPLIQRRHKGTCKSSIGTNITSVLKPWEYSRTANWNVPIEQCVTSFDRKMLCFKMRTEMSVGVLTTAGWSWDKVWGSSRPPLNHLATSWRSMLSRIELTAASRPLLLPDETLLFVQNAVGLYEGYIALPPAHATSFPFTWSCRVHELIGTFAGSIRSRTIKMAVHTSLRTVLAMSTTTTHVNTPSRWTWKI